METRQTEYVEKRAEIIQPNSTQPIMHETHGYAMAPGGEGYPRDPVITEQRHEVIADSHGMGGKPKKQGFGAKLKNMFSKKNKKGAHGPTHGHGGNVIEETVHTTKTTTTTTLDQGAIVQGHHQHMHGPLVANPYAQPAHGQIFVPANSAVQANPETGALLPASNLNGPVILPTGPKVIPIATNYPASQAGPMVIPPSGGFINNSGNPYLTQQTYGPAYGPSGIVETHVRETDYVDTKANKRLEKEEMRHQKTLEKEHKRLEKEELKREKVLEKDQIRLEKQMEKDQTRIDKQLQKDEAKLAKDQERLGKTLEKDEARLENNQMKLQNKLGNTEAKLENKVAMDQMRVQETLAKEQNLAQAPIYTHTQGAGIGGHGVKHTFVEETKQDAYTGQIIDHNAFHKDTRF